MNICNAFKVFIHHGMLAGFFILGAAGTPTVDMSFLTPPYAGGPGYDSNVKKRKRGNYDPTKNPGDKDLFNFVFPKGYQRCNALKDQDDTFLTENVDTSKEFFVSCPKCSRITYSASKSRYTNSVSHARTCLDNIEGAYHSYMGQLADEDEIGAAKVQLNLSDALCHASSQDKALFMWTELVCDHNIALFKTRDKTFTRHLEGNKHVGYDMLVSLLLRLSIIVEEKIAKEMQGKKGGILHDGWSRHGRHYVALMASYLVKNHAGDLETVVRLLSCSTLPHDDDDGCE